jgi:hypothetical protein
VAEALRVGLGAERVDLVARLGIDDLERPAEARVLERLDAPVLLQLRERVRLLDLPSVLDELAQRLELVRERLGRVDVRLPARVVVRGRVPRGQDLAAADQRPPEPVEHRQHQRRDVVGVDLVAGEEHLVQPDVRVERQSLGRAAAPLEDEVVDEGECVEALRPVVLEVREPGPAARAVQQAEVGQRRRREREAGQLPLVVAEGFVRPPVDRVVQQETAFLQVVVRLEARRVEHSALVLVCTPDKRREEDVVRVVQARRERLRGRAPDLRHDHCDVELGAEAERVRRSADERAAEEDELAGPGLLPILEDVELDRPRLAERHPDGDEPRLDAAQDRAREDEGQGRVSHPHPRLQRIDVRLRSVPLVLPGERRA